MGEKKRVEPYIKTTEAAEYLGVSSATLRDLCRLGEVPYRQLSSRVKLFKRADLDEWLAARTSAVMPERGE